MYVVYKEKYSLNRVQKNHMLLVFIKHVDRKIIEFISDNKANENRDFI